MVLPFLFTQGRCRPTRFIVLHSLVFFGEQRLPIGAFFRVSFSIRLGSKPSVPVCPFPPESPLPVARFHGSSMLRRAFLPMYSQSLLSEHLVLSTTNGHRNKPMRRELGNRSGRAFLPASQRRLHFFQWSQ